MAMKTCVYRDNRYDMYRKAGKQVLNTNKCEVLVLHSRRVSRDSRKLPLSGTVTKEINELKTLT